MLLKKLVELSEKIKPIFKFHIKPQRIIKSNNDIKGFKFLKEENLIALRTEIEMISNKINSLINEYLKKNYQQINSRATQQIIN